MKNAFLGIHIDTRRDLAVSFQKYMMSLNAAAILWKADAKEDADATTQVANSKFLNEYNYMILRGVNLSSLQAIMVFSDAIDSNNVKRLSFVQDGKLIIDSYGYSPKITSRCYHR